MALPPAPSVGWRSASMVTIKPTGRNVRSAPDHWFVVSLMYLDEKDLCLDRDLTADEATSIYFQGMTAAERDSLLGTMFKMGLVS